MCIGLTIITPWMFVVFLFLLFLLWYSVVEVEVESGDVHVQALVFIKIVLVIVINNTTAFGTVTTTNNHPIFILETFWALFWFNQYQ